MRERLRTARQALSRFDEALGEPKTPMNRDACIQRFEFTCETAWKAAQSFPGLVENIEAASPSRVLRAGFQTGVLSEEQAREGLRMSRDRNLTVRTCNEQPAEEIYASLPRYAALIGAWLDAVASRLPRSPAASLR